MASEVKHPGGRPSKDRVRRTYTIDREVAEYIDSLPDGERSNFVSESLTKAKERQKAMVGQKDGNIRYQVEGMVARVSMNGNELFSSSDWEKAQERYTEALMLRDQSGFKDAATIRKHLEQIEEQYG